MPKISKIVKPKIKKIINKTRNATFVSSPENIRHLLDSCNNRIDLLRKEAGPIKVSVFFKCLDKKPEYKKMLEIFKDKTINEMLDTNRDLFIEIIYKEIKHK